jgi:hypothetical protein
MKQYTHLSAEEKLKLTNEEYADAVRMEAVERGVAIPIRLSEALRNSEYRGFQLPAEFLTVWRIISHSDYSRSESDFAYLSEERAMAALEGIVCLKSSGYGTTSKLTVSDGEPRIQKEFILRNSQESRASKFVEFTQDTSDFDKIEEECREDWSTVRQAAYNKRVNLEKKAEYLRLAANNEEIAKAFWSKAERSVWPE